MSSHTEIVRWWFGAALDDAAAIGERMDFWFSSQAGIDDAIRERFAVDVERASRGLLDDWANQASGRLALILLLDQFRRNLYRGRSEAFACDETALGLCVEGIELALDRQLQPVQRLFFYMPMQHSESREVQERSVAMFDALAGEASGPVAKVFGKSADFARLHKDIVDRFGRFPHRNAVLGRTSTAAETHYLTDAPRFGQG